MADEPQNTEPLRAQAALLLSQARGLSADILRALGAASGDSGLHSRLAAAAAQISGVASALSQALTSSVFPLRAADLMALESVVHSGETSTLLAEASAQAATSAAHARNLATASVAARQEVRNLSHDLFEQRIFEPYLHFSSPDDEAEFRKHQAEDKKYINEQLARGTPEGDLNASGGLIGSMLDANVHGAGDSPDFMPRWNALVDKTQHLRAAVQAAGQSTDEFDRHVTASVRGFLKAKGLSDAEIDKRLAAAANPLDAVKPFLDSARDSKALEQQMELAVKPATSPEPLPRADAAPDASARDAQLGIDMTAMDARLQAAGLQPSGNTAATGHGLSIAKPAGKAGQSVAG
jgi:hypothetical protein